MASKGACKQRACLICTAPTTYAHFGIDSCRACAEFYKRTLTSNKNYACRQGNRKCVISKNERFICRRCRFEKCRELGMSLDDPRKKCKKEKMEVIDDPCPTTPSTSITALTPVTPGIEEHLLERIARAHTFSINRRRAEELAMRTTSLRNHVRVESHGDDVLMSTWTFLMECLRKYVGDYLDVASTSFPEFSALTIENKLMMLQNCALRLFVLESHVLTHRTFRTPDGPFCMVTLTTCIDRDNLKFFIEEENPSTRHGEIVRSMSYYISRVERLIWPILSKTDLTDTEFSALLGLVVWQFDPHQTVAEHLTSTAERIRNDIFTDLRRYYREELKLADYSVRLGNLMSLEHTVQEASSLMGEELQTYNLLNMLQADTSFLQIVLQIKL